MIYQIYYHPNQRKYCFNQPPYKIISTKPEAEWSARSDDIRNVPMLREEWVRQQLCEYSVMIYHWQSRYVESEWVGFTSWRQLTKGYPYIIEPEGMRALSNGRILTWGIRNLDMTLDVQAEYNHPGIIAVMQTLLGDIHRQEIPREFFHMKTGVFCSYWAAPRRLFEQYMRWSYPIIVEAIARWGNDPPFNRHEGDAQVSGRNRSLAFLQERLFNVWLIRTRTLDLVGGFVS